MSFDNAESLPTSSVLMAKPTPAIRLATLLRLVQKKLYPAPTSLISPTSVNRLSLSVAILIY